MDRNFNSHPHEEDDAEGLVYSMFDEDFNSHPHEEDDAFLTKQQMEKLYFNSHPHEEDDDTYLTSAAIDETFQLTSSRRG